jgi:hypothetical protein
LTAVAPRSLPPRQPRRPTSPATRKTSLRLSLRRWTSMTRRSAFYWETPTPLPPSRRQRRPKPKARPPSWHARTKPSQTSSATPSRRRSTGCSATCSLAIKAGSAWSAVPQPLDRLRPGRTGRLGRRTSPGWSTVGLAARPCSSSIGSKYVLSLASIRSRLTLDGSRLQDWSSYVELGAESWKRFGTLAARRQVGLRFLWNVISLEPAAFSVRSALIVVLIVVD